MEISNRAFGIFCVAVVGVVVYVRAQSSNVPVTAAAPAPVAAAPAAKSSRVHHGIPNSTLPPDPTAGTSSDDQPIIVSGDLPAILPAPAPAAPPIAKTTAPPTIDTSQNGLANQDDLGDLGSSPTTDQGNSQPQLSDRDVLRIMLGTMNDQQREEFRAVWYTMTPDDRQSLIDEVRGSQ